MTGKRKLEREEAQLKMTAYNLTRKDKENTLMNSK